MNKIKIFKLISGEEIIGELFNPYDKHYEVKNPAVIVMQQSERGVGIALMPFMPYSEGHTTNIMRHAILVEAEPSQNMVNEYNRIYGSGIEIASASALAGLQVAS